MARHVHTVLGPVDPASLGRVLHHEHLLAFTPGPWLSGGKRGRGSGGGDPALADDDVVADQVRHAVSTLSGLADLGYDTVADLSPYDVVGRSALGENVELLRTISQQSGVHIVAGSAIYLEPYSPTWAKGMNIDELTQRFTADVTTGIGESNVRAGVLGEQATGLNEITEHEERCLRAAARTQAATGVSLATHTTHGTMGPEQIRVIASEGADLSRVVIGHMDIQPDLDEVVRVLDSGASIAFDTIGKQSWDFVLEPEPPHRLDGEFAKRAYFCSDSGRADRLMELLRRGYGGQLLISQDLTGIEAYLNPSTHGRWGLQYIGAVFLAELRERGLSPQQEELLTRTNPLNFLSQGAE